MSTIVFSEEETAVLESIYEEDEANRTYWEQRQIEEQEEAREYYQTMTFNNSQD